MSGVQQGFPQINAPISDPQTGLLNLVWLNFFRVLWQRTGSATGTDSTNLSDLITLGGVWDDDTPAANSGSVAGLQAAIADEADTQALVAMFETADPQDMAQAILAAFGFSDDPAPHDDPALASLMTSDA